MLDDCGDPCSPSNFISLQALNYSFYFSQDLPSELQPVYIYLSTQALCLNVYAITQPVRAPILTSPLSSRSPFTAIPSFKQLSSKALASSFSHTPHPTHGKILLATSTSDYVRTLTTFYHFHHFHACLSDHDLLPGLSSWSPDWSPCFRLHPSRGLFSIRSWNNLPK